MAAVRPLRPLEFRSIFISDIHLGFKGCQARMLLEFLRSTRCQHLFLVGDNIDLWNMRNGLYWPQEHNDVIRTLLGKTKHGTQVIYVPGNHDEALREDAGADSGGPVLPFPALVSPAGQADDGADPGDPAVAGGAGLRPGGAVGEGG
jgi:UDP-2,3-diacylglucosamine pyrophosphatase LpxH